MQHLKDYVWMQLGTEPPIQVRVNDPADEHALTQKLAAGYRQIDEPAIQLNQESE